MHSKRIQKKVKEDYNKIAEDFSSTRNHSWKDFEVFRHSILEFSANYKGKLRILDLGCGNGRLVNYLDKLLGEEKYEYLGVDQSSGLLKQANKLHPKRRFICEDFSDLSVKELNGEFDLIFSVAAFHHLPKKDFLPTLRNWKNMLHSGGLLIMTNWNLHQKRFWTSWLKHLFYHPCGLNGLMISWKGKLDRYYYRFTQRHLNKLAKKTNMFVVDLGYVKKGLETNWIKGENIFSIFRKK